MFAKREPKRALLVKLAPADVERLRFEAAALGILYEGEPSAPQAGRVAILDWLGRREAARTKGKEGENRDLGS